MVTIFGQKEITVRSFDRDARSSPQLLERLSAGSRAKANTELNRRRTLRSGRDRVRAGDAFRKSEIHPLPRLEAEIAVVNGDRQLDHRRRQLFNLRDVRRVRSHHLTTTTSPLWPASEFS